MSAKFKKPAKRASSIAIFVEDASWNRSRGLAARVRRAAELALVRADAPRTARATILLTDDKRLKELNSRFRGKSEPTNVLSFPAVERSEGLGDIAIAYGVCVREARAAAKPLAKHAAHLAVHGILHLLGYDHMRASEAETMEALETKILAELGIADPYAARKAA